VSVIGRSLGSAVATFLASRRPAMSLVLVTPPDSALAVARRLYPFFPVGWMLKDRYETVAFAPAVEQPVLIITAQHDRVVPAEHAETLAAAFRPGQVRWLTVDGAGHNDLSAHTAYWRGMAEFVGAADAATGR